MCQGRKGLWHAERESGSLVSHISRESLLNGTCRSFPPLPSPFFPNLSKNLSEAKDRGAVARCISDVVGNACARIAYNSFVLRPSIQAVHARVRARAAVTGSTWISIIVIKHAASMNYLFVGTAEYMRRMESKKKRKHKEELESVKKKKKHVPESIIKAVKCLRPFPAGYWVHSAKDRKQERVRSKKGREKGWEKLLSLPRFIETRAGLDICILRRALGGQSSRCVALILDSATRGMTLTHRRTRRV